MKARMTILLILDNKIFGPKTEDRTRLDIKMELRRALLQGVGIQDIDLENFEILEWKETG